MENNYILETFAGNDFTSVSDKAKKIAELKMKEETGFSGIVEFDFNGITCLVNKDTNLDYLFRDYMNAHMMEWEIIGPDCVENYPDDVKQEIIRREQEEEEKSIKMAEERRIQEEKEKAEFLKKTEGIEMEITDKEYYDKMYDVNKNDGYGMCTLEYAIGWAKLMQVEIAKGKTVAECAEEESFKMGFLGISGAMYGFAVSFLGQCWKHGEELRNWHNKAYGYKGDGVVNPAILTINTGE